MERYKNSYPIEMRYRNLRRVGSGDVMQINHIEALINQGELFLAQGEFSKAFDCFLRATKLNPNSAKALCGLGQCEKFLGKVDDAITSLEQAISIDPTLSVALYNLADLLFDRGKYDIALGYFEQALVQQPNSWMILDGLGQTLGKLGRFDEALQHFDSATQQALGKAVIWNNYGWALMNLNRLEEALRSLERSIALDPKFYFAWLNLGVVQRRLGLSDAAAKNLEMATLLFPDNKWPWIERGKCLESLGNLEAISCFRKAIEISPQFSQAWLELGWTYLESCQPKEAKEAFNKCLKLDPRLVAAHIGLGHALTELGQVVDAMKSYEVVFSTEDNTKIESVLNEMFTKIESEAATIPIELSPYMGLVDLNDVVPPISVERLLENKNVVPLIYLLHQMTFRLSQLSRREFGVSMIELPYTYFLRYADLKGKGGRRGIRMAKRLPQIWWALAAQRSEGWGALKVRSEMPSKEPTLPLFLGLPAYLVYFHELICHCFDFPMHRWLMDTGKDTGKDFDDIDDLFQPMMAEYIAQNNFFGLASRACSEGFAQWLQFYGGRVLSERFPNRATQWKAKSQWIVELSETISYRIGLDVFEVIEKHFGELCSVTAYFVAFDLPRKFDLTALSADEARLAFCHSINNPNFRLQSLVGMHIPWDFQRNDSKRFITLAKAHITKCCEKTPRCTISGRSVEGLTVGNC